MGLFFLFVDTVILIVLIQLVSGQLGKDNVDWVKPAIIAFIAGVASNVFLVAFLMQDNLTLVSVLLVLAGAYAVLRFAVTVGCSVIMGMEGKQGLIVGGSYAIAKFFITGLYVATVVFA